MSNQYEASSLNQYAHCPTFPIHTPITGPLNCNSDYDVDKVYDNYIPFVVKGKQMEHFGGTASCADFLIKLIIFVTIMWFIIYVLLQNK